MNDDLDMRAAEYVLGTLDANERHAFQREVDANAEARASVAYWESRLAPLASLSPSLAPPPDMWSRIERALPSAVAPTVLADNIVALRRAATNWRRAAVFSGALAAGLLIFVIGREALPPRQAGGVYFAAINRGGDQPALIVRVDLATQTVYVRPISAETPEGKSLEMRMIPSGEKPKSMGVVRAESERLPAPKGFAIEKATFAVSVEPEGGSPTGGPTGPIVYSGVLVRE
jgi:anti-sigma-K factor RskA